MLCDNVSVQYASVQILYGYMTCTAQGRGEDVVRCAGQRCREARSGDAASGRRAVRRVSRHNAPAHGDAEPERADGGRRARGARVPARRRVRDHLPALLPCWLQPGLQLRRGGQLPAARLGA